MLGRTLTCGVWRRRQISLIIDEDSLQLFPEDAIVGSSERWRPMRLCGKSFAFDVTGVVSAMFAPYEEGMPLLNISTFSTNISLVEESDLERALASFDVPVVDADVAGGGMLEQQGDWPG